MNFERGKNIKKSLKLGKYAKALKVISLVHGIMEGPNIVKYTLPDTALITFLKYMERGIYLIPSDLKTREGWTREQYSLNIIDHNGESGQYNPYALKGSIIEFNGEYFNVPNKEFKQKIMIFPL